MIIGFVITFIVLLGVSLGVFLSWVEGTEDLITKIGYTIVAVLVWFMWVLMLFASGMEHKENELREKHPTIEYILATEELTNELIRANENIDKANEKYNKVLEELEGE